MCLEINLDAYDDSHKLLRHFVKHDVVLFESRHPGIGRLAGVEPIQHRSPTSLVSVVGMISLFPTLLGQGILWDLALNDIYSCHELFCRHGYSTSIEICVALDTFLCFGWK